MNNERSSLITALLTCAITACTAVLTNPCYAQTPKGQIVALGEATHGTRQFFQLKHRMLQDEEMTVTTAASGKECLVAFEKRMFSCVLLDVWLPGIDGIETRRIIL